MDIDWAREFITANRHGVLTTLRRDGRPQMSPVTAGIDEAGRVVVSVTEDRAKTRNARRDPRVALCVFTDGFYGPWVAVDGTVEIISLPDAMEPLVDLYRQVQGEHPDWDDYRAAMERDRRVIIALTPESAGPDHHA